MMGYVTTFNKPKPECCTWASMTKTVHVRLVLHPIPSPLQTIPNFF